MTRLQVVFSGRVPVCIAKIVFKGFIERADWEMGRAWLQDLADVGYVFPEVVPGSEALPLEDSMHERLLRGLPFINALQAFRIARGLALRQPGEGATEVFEHDTAPASPLRLFLRSWRQGLHPLPPRPPPRARAARTVI